MKQCSKYKHFLLRRSPVIRMDLLSVDIPIQLTFFPLHSISMEVCGRVKVQLLYLMRIFCKMSHKFDFIHITPPPLFKNIYLNNAISNALSFSLGCKLLISRIGLMEPKRCIYTRAMNSLAPNIKPTVFLGKFLQYLEISGRISKTVIRGCNTRHRIIFLLFASG